jgi:uncharacterized membrane protein YfcA
MLEHVTALGAGRVVALMAATVVAGLIRGFTGFGAALVMAPAFALVVPPREAVVLITVLNLVTMTQLLPPALKQTDWHLVTPMSVAAVLALPLGTWLLVVADGDVLRRVIAVVVAVFAGLLMIGWQSAAQPRMALSFGVGAISGVLTGVGGIGGPPVVLYLLSRPSDAARYRASFISYFAAIQAFGVIPLVAAGLVEMPQIVLAGVLLPPYFLSTYAGSRLFTRASDGLYRNIAIGVLLAIAAAALLA